MEFSRQIQEAIKILAGTAGLKNSITVTGTVVSVDEDNRLCDVEIILGEGNATLKDVHLSAENNDGLIQIPADKSTVIVLQMPDNENYVIAFSDVKKLVCYIDGTNHFEFSSDGFIWNGGLLGGMALTQVITAKLNLLEAFANEVIAAVIAINNAAIGSPVVPVLNASLAAFLAPIVPTPLTPTIVQEIEDTRIKH